MQELIKTTSELSAAIDDTLTVLRDSVEIVVTEIATELASFVKLIGLVVSRNIINLIDDIFALYSYEWTIANRSIQELNNYINTLIYIETIRINRIINNFTILTAILIREFADQIALIDLAVSPQYNERMFAIYGRIAEFSVAINAPPSYLEEAIQNARFFAMAIACSAGLSYYQFQSDWNDGVERLLIHIRNSISLYQQNPQRIKIDIERTLIKPIFEMEVYNRRQERQQLINLSNRITNLQGLMSIHKIQMDENKQVIMNLYELEIAPILKEIIESFDIWKKDVYGTKMKVIDRSFVSLFLQIVEAIYETRKILGLLDYGGDLLLRVNKLSGYLRIEQEDKIADVTTRSFRRLVPDWLSEVRKSID